MKTPCMQSPCSNCPFRKDSKKGWLGGERMAEILNAQSFVCHKTIDGKTERKQCAGHMLVRGNKNQFFRIAPRLGVSLNLKGKELVFSTEQECIEHHAH